jgi:hypothetical protein
MLTPLIAITLAATQSPAQITPPGHPTSVLDYTITDESGLPTPIRLTFLHGDKTDPGSIFTNPNVDPTQLAVRRNVVYDIDGAGAITIPPGEWFVIASRGMEYDIATTHIGPSEDSHVQWKATLRRAIDTAGWAGGDFHLHTLTHSGHGDSNMPERMISIAGEGVEFAVATDHNHNTDYRPTMAEVGAAPHFTAVTGNEISTNYGHFNAYPLDPNAAVIDWKAEAPAMFAETRTNANTWNVTPVIQVNHPRWGNIDYFGDRDLDPFEAKSNHPDWSWDFDAIEVLNENAGWGWYDAEVTDVPVRASRHSVVRDWINMVNAGHAVAPMGNSDSHAVEKNFAGIPRTYVRVDDTLPNAIDPAQVAESIRRGAVIATTGPFITLEANGGGIGDLIAAESDQVNLTISVQAAPWIAVDRIRILVDGDQVRLFNLSEDGFTPPLSIGPIPLHIAQDAWITVLAESDTPMSPVVRDRDRPILPLCITGPIRVDANGDGTWTPPLDALSTMIDANDEWSTIEPTWRAAGPHRRAMITGLAARQPQLAANAIQAALGDHNRIVRIAGIKAATSFGDDTSYQQLAALVSDPTTDRSTAFSAWAACDTIKPAPKLLQTYLDRFGWDNANRYAGEHALRLPGRLIQNWQVAGCFPAATMQALAEQQAPEPGIVHFTPPLTKAGTPLAWHDRTTNDSGFLDLAPICDEPTDAIAYATCTLDSPNAREVRFAIGTDDGCRVWVNSDLVFDDPEYHGATRDAKTFTAMLKPGDNTILCKVLNGTQDFGLYLRVMDNDVKESSTSNGVSQSP